MAVSPASQVMPISEDEKETPWKLKFSLHGNPCLDLVKKSFSPAIYKIQDIYDSLQI